MMNTHAARADDSALAKVAAQAWNWAHSDQARRHGVRLAVVCKAAPQATRTLAGEVALFAPPRRAPTFMTFDGFKKAAARLTIADVVLMRDDVPESIEA